MEKIASRNFARRFEFALRRIRNFDMIALQASSRWMRVNCLNSGSRRDDKEKESSWTERLDCNPKSLSISLVLVDDFEA